MAKGKVPAALKAYQFKKGSTTAAKAGARGGKKSTTAKPKVTTGTKPKAKRTGKKKM
jgi:hypothetical protein